MTDAPDSFEEELAALRPHDASPGLRQRLAEHRARSLSSRSRWRWGLALTGGLAAACLAVVILLGRWGGQGNPRGHTTADVSSEPAGARDDSLPTLRVYQHALTWSPEELNALLDRHAARASRSDSRAARVSAFPRSDIEIQALVGGP
jgi:hypothetical protein